MDFEDYKNENLQGAPEEYGEVEKMEIDFSANSWEELFGLFDEAGGIHDGDNFYNPEDLKKIVEGIRKYERGVQDLPNVGKLRHTVEMLTLGELGEEDEKQHMEDSRDVADNSEAEPAGLETKKDNPGLSVEKMETDFSGAQNFDELFELIDKSGGVEGSRGFHNPDELKDVIDKIIYGELDPVSLTRKGGLREKVIEFLGNPDLVSRYFKSKKTQKFGGEIEQNVGGSEPQEEVAVSDKDQEGLNEEKSSNTKNEKEGVEEKNNPGKESFINADPEVGSGAAKEECGPGMKAWEDFGFTEQDLENQIENYKELSPGQKVLFLENFKQLTLGRVYEESGDQYKKDVAGSGFLSRIWKGISKNYQIAKLEKEKANDLATSGIEDHKDILSNLSMGMKEFGPDVEIKEDGKVEVQYMNITEGMEGEEKEKIKEFNKIAYEFSKIPYEWSLPEATSEQRMQFDEAREKYKHARAEVLELVAQKSGDQEAALNMNSADEKIQVNQFLNSNPEAEERLKNIKDESVWKKAFENVATERGLYMVGGYLARTATASLIGAAAVPLVAVGRGGFLARKRAKEEVKERAVFSRRDEVSTERGIELGNIMRNISKLKEEIQKLYSRIDNSEKENFTPHEVNGLKSQLAEKKAELKKLEKEEQNKFLEHGDYVDAEYLSSSFNTLIEDLQLDELNKSAKKEMVKSLKFHIEEAERKMEDGTVNFGSGASRLANQYELMQQLGRARASVASEEIFTDKNIKKEYREDKKVVEDFLVKQDEDLDRAKKKYINKKMLQGAAISGGFAIAGYGLRVAGEHLGWWKGAQGQRILDDLKGKEESKVELGGKKEGILKEAAENNNAEVIGPASDRERVPEEGAKQVIREPLDVKVHREPLDKGIVDRSDNIGDTEGVIEEKKVPAETAPDVDETEEKPESHPEAVDEKVKKPDEILNQAFEGFFEEKNIPIDKKLAEEELGLLVQSMREDKIGAGDISNFLKDKGYNLGEVNKIIYDVISEKGNYPDGVAEEHVGGKAELGEQVAGDDLSEGLPAEKVTEKDIQKIYDEFKESLNKEQKQNLADSEEVKNKFLEYAEGTGGEDLRNKAEGFLTKMSMASPDLSEIEIPEPAGLKNNFTLKLGEAKVPLQLERVFHMMSADAMDDAVGADNMFGEEEGAKSLNVAANLVQLAKGKGAPGVDSETFKQAVEWNPKTMELQIKDYETFNEIVKSLHGHADELWEKGVLQKGATAYLDDIKQDTWEDIVKAEGLEKVGDIETGIEGHDELETDQITDFEKSAIVEEAEKIMPQKESAGSEQVAEVKSDVKENTASADIVQSFSEIDISNDDEVKGFLEVTGFNEMTAKEQHDLLEDLKAKAHDLDGEIIELKEINPSALEAVTEEYKQTKELINFLQGKHEAEYREKTTLYNMLLESIQKEIASIKNLADKAVENKIAEIYSYKFLFFKGSQIEEWQVMQNKLALDVKNGNFGEPLGYTKDAAELNNRMELQSYVDEAVSAMKKAHLPQAEPTGKETVKEFLTRYEEWKIMTRTEQDSVFVNDVNRVNDLGRELGYIKDDLEHDSGDIKVETERSYDGEIARTVSE